MSVNENGLQRYYYYDYQDYQDYHKLKGGGWGKGGGE